MSERIEEFEKLSPENKEFIKRIIKSLAKEETPEEKAQRQQEQQHQKQERMESEKHFEEVRAKCDTMTAKDYRRELNKIFKYMECYKLRYFYIFITEKLKRSQEKV